MVLKRPLYALSVLGRVLKKQGKKQNLFKHDFGEHLDLLNIEKAYKRFMTF